MENNYRKEAKAEISFILLASVTSIHLSIIEVPIPKGNILCDLEKQYGQFMACCILQK